MEKLKNLSRQDLKDEYSWIFGQNADGVPTEKIIAAIYYGKRVNSITEEELAAINEY